MPTVGIISTSLLLAFLLLPKLKETATNRNERLSLTIITSDSHCFVDFEDKTAPETIFNGQYEKSNADTAERYPVRKLVGICIVCEMAARIL